MGSIEHIDQLEEMIDEFGSEIKKVKKASEYLHLIEQFQTEISKAITSIDLANEQLKVYQDLVESKLELFISAIRNVEEKQRSTDQKVKEIEQILIDHKRFLESMKRQLSIDINSVTQTVHSKHQDIISLLKKQQAEQTELLENVMKKNKLYFIINTGLGVLILGLVVFLLV